MLIVQRDLRGSSLALALCSLGLLLAAAARRGFVCLLAGGGLIKPSCRTEKLIHLNCKVTGQDQPLFICRMNSKLADVLGNDCKPIIIDQLDNVPVGQMALVLLGSS